MELLTFVPEQWASDGAWFAVYWWNGDVNG